MRAPVSFSVVHFFILFFLLALLLPWAKRGQDLTVVCSEAQHSSFSLSSWDHFLKVTTHTYIQTQSIHSNKPMETYGRAEGEVRRGLKKCKTMHFLSQTPSVTQTHFHTHSAAVNLYACDSQVNKVTCLCTLSEELFLRTFQVYSCRVTHFHHPHQSCTHNGMYL